MDDIDRATFKSELRRAGEDLSPARANLLLAREIAYPDLRPSDYVIQLDDLSVAGHAALAGYPTPETRGLALAEFLFHSVGFRGDSHDYTNPRNSYLNDVLEQRAGLPISLSVIFLEVARRLGIAAAGVGMPGHFLIKYADDGGEVSQEGLAVEAVGDDADDPHRSAVDPGLGIEGVLLLPTGGGRKRYGEE